VAKFLSASEEQAKDLGALITDMWDEDNQDRNEWLANLPKWLDAYQGRPQPKKVPFTGASNLMVPITATTVDAIHPRIMAALFKPRPICTFKAQEPSDMDLARKYETFLDYVCREECNLFPVTDRITLNMLIYGVQVVKTSWALEIKQLRVKHEFPLDTDPAQAIQAILQGEQAYADAIERVTDEAYEVTMKGRKVTLEVARTPSQLIIFTDREEVEYDGVAVDLIQAEDIAFNSDCPYDLQKADHIIERYFLTLDQIKRHVKIGQFEATKDELQALETLETDIAAKDTTGDVKDYRESITGARETNREGSPYDKIELYDAYVRYDLDDDGYDECLLVTIPVDKPDLYLRIHRLEDVYAHGKFPFTLFYYNPIGKTVWAQGIPQMVDGLQTEINIIHNQRNDAGMINNTPFGWYVPGAGMPKERMTIQPGFLNPVGDVNQIRMHQPGNYHAWAFQEEQMLFTLLERRTKVSDITIGRVGEVQGAARTATGVQALSAQQATGFDITIRRVQEPWKDLLRQIMALYQEYMPDDRFVRITGSYGEPDYVVTRSELGRKMDMIFTGNSLNTDREVERNTTTFLAQSVMSPAALGFNLQTKVMDPQSIAEWYRYLFGVFDIPNLDRMIKIPEIPVILKPEEILNRLMSGERLRPKQGENHQDVIMLITEYLQSPKAFTLDPEILILLQGQIPLRQQQAASEQVQQMMQQQMMMQQQQMMAQQMGGGPNGQIQMPPGMGGAPPQIQAPQPGGLTF
jgi:hypothetical protein